METSKDKRLHLFQRPQVNLTLLSSKNDCIITKEYGKLVDLESGCWAAVLGHSKTLLQETIKNLEFPFHTHQFFDSSLVNQLIEKIESCAQLPLHYAGAFTTSGSEAVSLAVMLAGLLTGRHKKLCLTVSYLGATPDLRLPRDPETWTDFNPADCLRCSADMDCEHCPKFALTDFSQYASFVFEPGNSGGTVIFPPEKLISFLTCKIKSSGGMLIVNEVTTGIGRTGKFFGYQYYPDLNTPSLSPDFIAMGKCLGNGYPISGVLTKSTYQSALEASGFRYVQSHSDDPLGITIALKTLNIIQSDHLVEASLTKGELLRGLLRASKAFPKTITEIRGRGLMNTIVLHQNIKAKDVFESLLIEGFFAGYSEAYNLIRLYPPLTIEQETIDRFCKTLGKILEKNQH